MSVFPTGNQLADTNVLLQLNDQDLSQTCRSNAYLNSLCSNDFFWKLKLEKYYPEALPMRRSFPSYQKVYQLVRNKVYVVFDTTSRVYNDIRQAYNFITSDLSLDFDIPEEELPSIEQAQELGNVAHKYGSINHVYIYSLPEREDPTGADPKEILLKLPGYHGTQTIISPHLADMPTLQPDLFLIYSVILPEHNARIRIKRLTSRNMEEILKASKIPMSYFGGLPGMGITCLARVLHRKIRQSKT